MFVQLCTVHAKLQSLGRLIGALLFMTLVCSGCARNPVTGNQDFVLMSEDSELALGRQENPKVIAEYGRYDNQALQRYVQSVGDKLVAVSHRKDLVYRFTVLDSPMVNAFALPGGYVYITRGLMAYLNSEAELAAVLGHEIGHVTARHGVRQQSAAQAANLGYTLGTIFFPELRAPGSQNAFNILGGALLSGYGREQELQADHLGAEYIAKAGYKPQAMIDVIRVLKAQEEFAAAEAKKQGQNYQGYHGLFASHPDNDTRLKQVVAQANQYKYADARQNGKELRDVYLHEINGMTFGDSEKQGIRSGNHFYHLSMHFALDFPLNWHINNTQESLSAIAPGGKATIELGATDINRKLSPQQFIKQRLKVDINAQAQAINSNGLEGYTGITTLKGKMVRIGVMYLNNRAFLFFAGAKTSADFAHYDADFLATIKSLHDLRPKEEKLAHGQHIEVVNAKQQDSYQQWAQHSPITNSPLSQLKLLNGDYPGGKLLPGQLYKRVE